MKLGTVLTLASLSGLALAQPAAAATRSADSLPSVSAPKPGVPARAGSKVGKTEKQGETMTSGEAILLYGSIALAIAAGVIIISDDNNKNIPDSP